MPVTLERFEPRLRAIGDLRERRLRKGTLRDRGRRLAIGLVNNMPDAAIASTERQFTRLLEASCGDYDVRLTLYSLEHAPRAAEARRAMAATYRPARGLRASNQDGLIVTGAEPRAPTLPEEPYWRELIGLFDWARSRTHSTLFSCLASHGAVLHWHGISRRPLARKLSGVYASRVVRRHRLLADLPDTFATPHSRLNTIDEAPLTRAGYVTLASSPDAGVGLFVREEQSLLVFLQDHPEYDADSLAREYRRDMIRYLNGERATTPDKPEHYFAPEVGVLVDAFAVRARQERAPEVAREFPNAALSDAGEAAWRAHASRFYRNWLEVLMERKAALAPSSLVARWGG
jgi:homoserine O-succinyltransferase